MIRFLRQGFPALLLTLLLAVGSLIVTYPAQARGPFLFDSIDGGTLSLSDWKGQPVLVVNTASRCAYTRQYDELQDLYDRYRDQGLVVIGIPSNDFRQELSTDAEVADFCEVNFGLDFPMTTITSVKGQQAHPFYKWLAETEGFSPDWNFNKVLLAPDGSVDGTFGSPVKPLSDRITARIEALLVKG